MNESAYKPTEAYEDELDQLAHSIRSELRLVGFRPAFDPEPEEVAAARRAALARQQRRAIMRRLVLGLIVPALAIVAVGVALWLLMAAI